MRTLLISLLLTCLIVLGGCQHGGVPITPCDAARSSLRLGVIGANAYFISYPDKATPEKIAKAQQLVNDGAVCIKGICADPNNLVYNDCLQRVLKDFGVEFSIIPPQGPIVIPEGI